MPLFKGSGVFLLSFLAGALFIASPAFADAPFSDDFESYTVDQSIVGQGDWTGAPDAFRVVNASSINGTTCASGTQCLFSAYFARAAIRTGTTVKTGSWDFALKLPSAPSTNVFDPTGNTGYISLYSPYGGALAAAIFPGSDPAKFSLRQNDNAILFDNLTPGTWHTVTLSWDIATTSCNLLVDVDHSGHPVTSFPGGPATANHCWPGISFPADAPPDGVNGISFVRTSEFNTWYVDDLKPTAMPPEAYPMLANLAQYQEDGTTPVVPGAGFIGNSVVLKAAVADQGSNAAALQVEVKPSNQPFDGTSLATSATTTASGTSLATTTLSIAIPELIPTADQYQPNGNHKSFHWRVRAIDGAGNASAWQEYSHNAASFTANVVALWTQVQSPYPGNDLTGYWSGQDYASGIDHSCATAKDNYHATIGRWRVS